MDSYKKKPTGLELAVEQANLEKAARGDTGPNGEFFFHTVATRRDGRQEVHTWILEGPEKGLVPYRYENGQRIRVDENWDMTPEEIKRRDYHRAYYQRKKAEREMLKNGK